LGSTHRSLNCLITYLGFYTKILALLDCISWVVGFIHRSMHCLIILHTDPCIAWLHILGSTHRSLHCLNIYLGFYTQIHALLEYSTHRSLHCLVTYIGSTHGSFLLNYISWVKHTDHCIV